MNTHWFVVVVVVGVGKGLGSVKETVSTIQELSKRRERELVMTLLLCKESTALSGDTCHWVSSMSVIKADCHSPYYSAPGRLWYPSRSYYNLGL